MCNGVAKAVVMIPKGTGEAIEQNRKANLTVMVDATDMTIYQNTRGGLGEATTTIVNLKIKQYGTAAEPQPLDYGMDFVYGKNLRVVDSMIPVVIAFMQSYIFFSLASMSIVKEKLARTFERMPVTPVRGSEILLGKLIASIIVTLAAMVILLIMGFWIFGIKMAGSIFVMSSG